MYEDYTKQYLVETSRIAERIAQEQMDVVERLISIIAEVKTKQGRVFFIGIGGGSGTGSHAANDFCKIAEVSTINLTDNPSLFTALTNDEGWDAIFIRQLKMHHCGPNDCVFVFSVGGGSPSTSPNIVKAVDYAKSVNAKVVGVVGKSTGRTAEIGDAVVVIPTMDESRITPHTENWQLIFDHLIVNAIANAGK